MSAAVRRISISAEIIQKYNNTNFYATRIKFVIKIIFIFPLKRTVSLIRAVTDPEKYLGGRGVKSFIKFIYLSSFILDYSKGV